MKLLVTSMLHAITTTYVTQENKNQNPKNRKLCLFKGLRIFYLTGFSLTMNPCYYCCPSLKNLVLYCVVCLLPTEVLTLILLQVSWFPSFLILKNETEQVQWQKNNGSLVDFFLWEILEQTVLYLYIYFYPFLVLQKICVILRCSEVIFMTASSFSCQILLELINSISFFSKLVISKMSYIEGMVSVLSSRFLKKAWWIIFDVFTIINIMPQAASIWGIEDSGCHPTVLYPQPKVYFPFFFCFMNIR